MKQIETPIKRNYFIQLGLALVGVALSLYLLLHHTRVKSGIQDSSSFCSFGRLADCDIVNVSRFSEIAGVPLASIGALYFFVLFLLGILAPPKSPNFHLVNRWMAWLTSFGLAFDLILLVGIQLWILHSFCLMCFLTYVANFGHLWLNFAGVKKEHKTHTLQSLFWGNRPWSLKAFSKKRVGIVLVSFVAFSLIVSYLPSFILAQSSGYQEKEMAQSDFFENWKNLPQKDISISAEDGTFGNPDAKVKIVVFSDFQCPFCKTAAFGFHTLLPSFGKKVHLIFKNFPLDPSCNFAVTHNMHPYACMLARLGYCAHKKGKFVQYHDSVFMEIEEKELQESFEIARRKLAPIFSESEIDSCLKDPASLEKIKKDIELGLSLNLEGTPATFINGRLVTIPLTPSALEKLIQLENG